MSWYAELVLGSSVAHCVFVLGLVAAAGLALGHVKIRGVSLGIGGVLFSGLLFGHFGVELPEPVMDFTREFGLILFVYTIGLQVGPGFFASLRRQGLRLNLLAASIVFLGVAATIVVRYVGDVDMPVAAGLFSGATTNTPSLAAAQQALKSLTDLPPEAVKQPALGYAVAYPFGILGIILAMGLVRRFFRVDVRQEVADQAREVEQEPAIETMNIEVTNPNLEGLAIRAIPGLAEFSVVVARMLHEGVQKLVKPDLEVHVGDVLLVVGTREHLERFRVVVGRESDIDPMNVPSNIVSRWLVVTQSRALGKTIHELDVAARYGVTITRVARSEVEFAPTRTMKLQFADRVRCVGEEAALDRVMAELGNSVKKLQQAQIIPVFIGLALGVLVGSIPLSISGIPAPVRLGLAGGPLIVAILLARMGHIGRLVWYMPASANLVLRELGIALFLAVVGLKAGDRFVETLASGQGWIWMAWGALITFAPLVIVAAFARAVFKLNFASLCGLLAGSMTDPPALAFATGSLESDAPSVSYATVYPLVMLLRVVSAQILVLVIL